jgi:hypothetical protein
LIALADSVRASNTEREAETALWLTAWRNFKASGEQPPNRKQLLALFGREPRLVCDPAGEEL